MSKQKTAVVLGGGGSKGALQAGFYRAVHEAGVRPDLVVAASVGALNGAFIACGMPPRLMMDEWSKTRRRDVFAFNWALLRRGASADAVYTFRRLRRFLQERLPVKRFEELRIPLIIVTTDLKSGRPYLWERGDLVRAILASCAIPGIFPPVEGPRGRLLVDGALSDNVPVGTALARGADRVLGILCPTGPQTSGKEKGLAKLVGRAFGIATDRKWKLEAPRYALRPEILVIDPYPVPDVQALDFSKGKDLCDAGYRASRKIIAEWLGELGTAETIQSSAAAGD